MKTEEESHEPILTESESYTNIKDEFSSHQQYPGSSSSRTNIPKKEHSIKVPRLYKEASKALQKIQQNGEGLKDAIYSIKHPNVKALTALVTESLRHDVLLGILITKSKLQENEPGFSIPLAKILITELLWGKKRLGGECKPVQTIVKYKDKFDSILQKIERKNRSQGLISGDDPSNGNSNPVIKKPRYVRINTLLADPSEVIDQLINEGCNQVEIENIDELTGDNFCLDPLVENLLVFPPSAEFHSHPLYLDGSLILQDKASCLPALALKPRTGRQVIDACAAPGMKTSLLAALMHNEGSILAIEKSEKRSRTLKTMIDNLGVNCVTVENKNFTDIVPEDYPDVEYILVDPSCSGSGMYGRIDAQLRTNDEAFTRERLESLAYYQRKLLLHAMKFPGVKKIVYSTCSVNSIENEEVVAAALDTNQLSCFRIKKALPNWPHRLVNSKFDWSENCLVADYITDRTDGFFVAVLERVKNKFSNNNKAVEAE